YTANASAISLAYGTSEGTHETAETSFTNETIHALTSSILAAAEAPGASKRDAALVTATVFYLLVALPRFRMALLVQTVFHVLGAAIYFPLLFIRSTPAIITLASVGMAWDIGMRHMQRIINPKKAREEEKMRECEEKQREAEAAGAEEDDDDEDHKTLADRHCSAYDRTINTATGSHVPALNIEHFLERTAAFVVIVLGEMVLSVVYHATTSQVGFQRYIFPDLSHSKSKSVFYRIYGIAICGLITAFNLCWLWFAGTMFTTLHFPLCAGLLIVSAAMSYFTKHETEAPEAIRWYFGGGLGCSMFCLAALGYTHRGLDPEGTTRISRRVQLIVRILVGVAFTCIPLAHNLSPLELMGIGAGLTSLLVMEETYGKLWRGEPISKPSASEKAAAEADAKNDEIIESPVEEKPPHRSKSDQ
ncbi:2875_t:CDS:2, partial [Acaulospora colombiana]